MSQGEKLTRSESEGGGCEANITVLATSESRDLVLQVDPVQIWITAWHPTDQILD